MPWVETKILVFANYIRENINSWVVYAELFCENEHIWTIFAKIKMFEQSTSKIFPKKSKRNLAKFHQYINEISYIPKVDKRHFRFNPIHVSSFTFVDTESEKHYYTINVSCMRVLKAVYAIFVYIHHK
jgi:hypothetical protein